MPFKKNYQTSEFIVCFLSVLAAFGAQIFNPRPEVSTTVICGILASYILSRGLFKKSRGTEIARDGFKTSEFIAWVIGLVFLTIGIFKGLDVNWALGNFGILSASFILSRGTAKGLGPQNKTTLIR